MFPKEACFSARNYFNLISIKIITFKHTFTSQSTTNENKKVLTVKISNQNNKQIKESPNSSIIDSNHEYYSIQIIDILFISFYSLDAKK